MLKKLKVFCLIVLGSLIFALGLNVFVVTNHLAQGGFTGIGLILYYTFDLSIGIFLLAANVPLLIIAWRFLGWRFVSLTLLGVLASSLFIELTAGLSYPMEDLLLASIYGGAVMGLGLGIVLRYGGTTGGVDIIGRLLNKYKGVRLSRFYLLFDGLIIACIALIYGVEITLYSLILTFVFSKVLDVIVDGYDGSRQFMIITTKAEEITQAITFEIDRGVTVLEAKGGYTGENKSVLLCVAGKWQVRGLKKIVKTIDPQSFLIVNDVYETLGEGFKAH